MGSSAAQWASVANPGSEDFRGSVALLTNFLPPYRIKVLELLQASVGQLRVFLSVAMEENRTWMPQWGGLDVVVQRNIAFRGRVVDPGRYTERNTVHVPYDTLWQLSKYRPDAIVAAEFGLRTAQAAIYKLLHPKTRLVVWATLSEHTERCRGAGRQLLRRSILRVADAVLVNGSSGSRYIQSLGFGPGRIFTVPQASDNAYFQGQGTRPLNGVLKLLYVGQLIERKGLQEFFAELKLWCFRHPERQVRWTIVGSGPLRSAIERWSPPPNCEVKLLADVPYSEVARHYHCADLFVLPSLADEWGLVVNEALISGLPILGSVYSQAVEELVREGVNGWTFHPDRGPEVQASLDAALSGDANRMEQMRHAAIESVRWLDFAFMKGCILTALNQPGSKSATK